MNARKRRQTFRPQFDSLDVRITPTNFTPISPTLCDMPAPRIDLKLPLDAVRFVLTTTVQPVRADCC